MYSIGSLRALLLVIVVAVLAGCGGGGDSAPPASDAGAEGAYGGNLSGSTSPNFQLLVLENGEFWSLYGTQTTTTFFVAGFAQGPGTASAGTYTSSAARDYGFSPALAGTVSATYNSTARTISGSLSAPGFGSVGFTGGPIAGSLYNYNTPATLSTVSGAWSLTAITGEVITLNINGTGSIVASTSLGCSFTGTITPRPSGKNVFNVSLSFGASPCALPGQTASGIAVAYPLSNGRTQLIVAGANSARTIGIAAFGTR